MILALLFFVEKLPSLQHFKLKLKIACDRQIKTRDKIKTLSYGARLRFAMQLLGKVERVTKDPGRTLLAKLWNNLNAKKDDCLELYL